MVASVTKLLSWRASQRSSYDKRTANQLDMETRSHTRLHTLCTLVLLLKSHFICSRRKLREGWGHQNARQLTQGVNAEPILRRLCWKLAGSLTVSFGRNWGTLRFRCDWRSLPTTAACMPATGGDRRALQNV